MKKIFNKKEKACPKCFANRSRRAKRYRRGFSFLEVVVATFIFAMIMVSTAAVFGRTFGGYRSARVIQKDLENAQFGMNSMAKMFRTSVVVSPVAAGTVSIIRVYDYSQASQKPCIEFQISGGSLQSHSLAATDKTACGTASFPAFSSNDNMTTGYVTGNFYVVPSATNLVGKLTTYLQICPSNPCTTNPKDTARIQTTVSLRNVQ